MPEDALANFDRIVIRILKNIRNRQNTVHSANPIVHSRTHNTKFSQIWNAERLCKKKILTERIFLLPVFNFRFFNAPFSALPVMIIGFIMKKKLFLQNFGIFYALEPEIFAKKDFFLKI